SLEKEASAAHRNVLPLAAKLIGADQRARAPTDVASPRKMTQRIDCQRIEHAILRVCDGGHEIHTGQRCVESGGRLPNSALRIRSRVNSRHRATGADI